MGKIDLTKLTIAELNEYALAIKNICDMISTHASINATDQLGHIKYSDQSLKELETFKAISHIVNREIKNKLLMIL